LEHGYGRVSTNLDLFEHAIPRCFGVDNEFIPDAVLDLRFMPLLVVENLVIVFNPNNPKCNAPKKVPNLDLLTVFLGKPFPESGLLPIETIIVANCNPT
jgi:hypothetical protein